MALIAMVRDRMVFRDNVVQDSTLSEGIALSSLLPGPVAVNVVAYVGYALAGFRGSLLSVMAVLLPSFVLVTSLAFLYFRYETIYDFTLLIAGIVPVVVAVILAVGVSMARKNCVLPHHFVVMLASLLILSFTSGYWPVVGVLVCAGMLGVLMDQGNKTTTRIFERGPMQSFVWIILSFVVVFIVARFVFVDSIEANLFVVFSGVSLTLFGGGYVMVPILKSMLVDHNAWLSYDEFAFGISIGQVTPGPILISAAFFGYKMAGIVGAMIATIGIFLPSSIVMILASHTFEKLRQSTWLSAAMKGIYPAVVGLILYSGFSLFYDHIQIHSIGLALFIIFVSLILVFRYKVATPLALMAGGAIAYLFS